MALEITISSTLSFVITTALLLIYTILDLRSRRISNRVMLTGGLTGLIIVVFTGHLIDHALLHLTAGIFMVVVAYVLFRVGAFGGADVKAVVTIAVLSPGVEFGNWFQPILEGIIASGLLLLAVLLVASVFSRYRQQEETSVTPLLPIMLIVYLAIQLLALV